MPIGTQGPFQFVIGAGWEGGRLEKLVYLLRTRGKIVDSPREFEADLLGGSTTPAFGEGGTVVGGRRLRRDYGNAVRSGSGCPLEM